MVVYVKKMSRLIKTLKDIRKTNIEFVLTRFDAYAKDHDDLDILVTKSQFDEFVVTLKAMGYKSLSHDQALGGRIKGAQINLTKKR